MLNNIDDLIVPMKETGNFRANLKLTDGSRLQVSGLTKVIALENLSYLISLVSPSFVPANANALITITELQGVPDLVLTCTQIEYYPAGKAAGVAPSIRRIIDVS